MLHHAMSCYEYTGLITCEKDDLQIIPISLLLDPLSSNDQRLQLPNPSTPLSLHAPGVLLKFLNDACHIMSVQA